MIYSVMVKPNSKKGPLVEVTNEASRELTVYLREKPVEGAANAALLKILAQYFSLPKTMLSLKSGARGRIKLVEILEKP